MTSASAARPPSPPRIEADAPRLPSPTPATPPPSPRAGARRRLLAFGLPLASPSADSSPSSRVRRAGTWCPAALANGASNSVGPGTRLPGGSSDEDERGGAPPAAGEHHCCGTEETAWWPPPVSIEWIGDRCDGEYSRPLSPYPVILSYRRRDCSKATNPLWPIACGLPLLIKRLIYFNMLAD